MDQSPVVGTARERAKERKRERERERALEGEKRSDRWS